MECLLEGQKRLHFLLIMLTITECRKLFKQNAEHLTDEQVIELIKLCDLLSKIVYKQVKTEPHEQESNSIY